MSKNLTKKNKQAVDKAIKELEKEKEPVFIEKLEQLLQRIDLNSNVSAICLMELCKDRSIDINAILNGKEK